MLEKCNFTFSLTCPLPLWPHLREDQVRVLISFSTPPAQSLIVRENLSTAPGCSGTQSAICHDKFIQHRLRAASQAISVKKLSALNTHWWQIIPLPPSVCASHYSLFSLSGDTSRPFASPGNRTNGRLFPALHVLITHSFCLLFSFL